MRALGGEKLVKTILLPGGTFCLSMPVGAELTIHWTEHSATDLFPFSSPTCNFTFAKLWSKSLLWISNLHAFFSTGGLRTFIFRWFFRSQQGTAFCCFVCCSLFFFLSRPLIWSTLFTGLFEHTNGFSQSVSLLRFLPHPLLILTLIHTVRSTCWPRCLRSLLSSVNLSLLVISHYNQSTQERNARNILLLFLILSPFFGFPNSSIDLSFIAHTFVRNF